MALQLLPTNETFGADLTFIWRLSRMFPHVYPKILLSRVLLWTLVTRVGLRVKMDRFVHHQHLFTEETFLTDRANKGENAIMFAHVYFQIVISLVDFVTAVTRKLSYFWEFIFRSRIFNQSLLSFGPQICFLK